jgi:hypothetical protein
VLAHEPSPWFGLADCWDVVSEEERQELWVLAGCFAIFMPKLRKARIQREELIIIEYNANSSKQFWPANV